MAYTYEQVYACGTEGRVTRADDILQQILADLAPHERERVRQGGLYADEPLLRTGRDLLNDRCWGKDAQRVRSPHPARPSARAHSPTQGRPRPLPLSPHEPEVERTAPIEAMRALARQRRTEGHGPAGGKLFVEQAHLMADYTDDLPFLGNFSSYYPTYEDMPDRVLRGYFTWRTHFRRGEVLGCPPAFVFVHAYEVLADVGVEPGQGGLRELIGLHEGYGADGRGRALDRYLPLWIRDYALVHDLDLSQPALAPYVQGRGDAVVRAVRELRTAQDALLAHAAGDGGHASGTRRHLRWDADVPGLPGRDVLVRALNGASTYHILASKVMRTHADDVGGILPQVFARLVEHCERRRKASFLDGLFGAACTYHHMMYSTAVCAGEPPHEDVTIALPSGEVVSCRAGAWWLTEPCEVRSASSELGLVLHTVDRILRERVGDVPPLKERHAPKYLTALVGEEVSAWLGQRAAARAAEVHIDRSQLGNIRMAASRTREALLVDEEREWEPVRQAAKGMPAAAVASSARPTPDPVDAPSGASSLTSAQRAILQALLAGDVAAARAAAAEGGSLLSLAVDTINELLFDLVGDTVIAFDGDEPYLVEDYAEDVREALS